MAKFKAKYDTPHKKEQIIVDVRNGNTRRSSYERAHVQKATFYSWLGTDEDFTLRLLEAEAIYEQKVLGVIEDAILGGNVQAAQWYLERRRGKEYGRVDKTVLTGDSDNPLEMKVNNFSEKEQHEVLDIILNSREIRKAGREAEAIPDPSAN